MNPRLRHVLTALLMVAALAGLPAERSVATQQALRIIDPQALAGRLAITQFPRARLDGREVLLAPGVRIRSTDNLLRLPASLSDEQTVRYRLDPGGQVIEVWLLTDEEAAQAAREPGGRR
jgi:hypothetical protein